MFFVGMEIRNRLFILKIKDKTGREFVKYALVGAFGFLLSLFLLYFFTEHGGIYYLISAAIASVIVGGMAFVFDKVWAFEEDFKNNLFNELFSFFIIGFFGLVFRLGMIYGFTEFFEVYYVVSQVFAICIVGVFSFGCDAIWTFRSKGR